jgi:hypothetical protein
MRVALASPHNQMVQMRRCAVRHHALWRGVRVNRIKAESTLSAALLLALGHRFPM